MKLTEILKRKFRGLSVCLVIFDDYSIKNYAGLRILRGKKTPKK